MLIENPPHNHSTIVAPTYGIADSKFVITVAPQKDICPHGNTYPRKAVAISNKRINIPETQVFVSLYELITKPRLMWMKMNIKKNLAVFMWTNRNSYP